MYNEYNQLNLQQTAKEVADLWQQNNTFEQSVETREHRPAFIFFEGPPSANGEPGIHHVMARTLKDIFCRYKTLKGFKVERKGGWDTHGLPVELKVEKELGITKEDIGKSITIEEFNSKCREAVMKFTDRWNELTERMGYWVDLKNPYITYEKQYVEALWGLLKKLYKRDLLYKGFTVQPYSPAAGTGLSSHELNLPGCYKQVKDTSITAQFRVIREAQSEALFSSEEEEVFFLAWTTTPWTLPSNSALVVGEGINYVKVKTYNPYTFMPVSVVLAEALVPKHFNEKAREISFADYKEGDKLIPWEVTGNFKGKELLDIRYEQLMPYVQPDGKAFVVIPGDFVTTEDGTGIVHTATLFGADDFRVSMQNDISPILVKDEEGNDQPLVDKQGRFRPEVTDFAGFYLKPDYETVERQAEPDYKPTDVLIAIKLKEENKAFKVEKYEHSYPHCWRTDKPILYYPLDSWFIRTTAYKDRMVELNKTINWKPASTGTGRFGNWLENLVDWNLSRSRYWGTPLPIWRTEDGTEEKCIGSLAELELEIRKSIAAGVMDNSYRYWHNDELSDEFDLHRPYVDEIVLVSDNGEPMKREADLIDVWFDSGAMPYAQWGFPTRNKEDFEAHFPADYISEGVDQTRGWFFTLHALGVMLQDSVAYKNVISTGLLLDEKGEKMSKRKGNVIDPFMALDKYGPDAIRWYMLENAPAWENLKFSLDGVDEIRRKFFGTLYNTYSFFALYANLDNFSAGSLADVEEQLTELDRWVISRLNSTIAEAEAAMEAYEPTRAVRALQSFVVDDLSNWYVRLNRKRFWKGEFTADKQAAYQTLHTVLLSLSKAISPYAPFFAEQLYQDLTRTGRKESSSVHLTQYPKVQQERVDAELEQRMELAQTISSLVHSIRKKERIKVRQPLQRVLVPNLDAKLTEQIEQVESIIKNEVNIKQIDFIDDKQVIVRKAKPNFPVLGKKGLGKKMKPLQQLIQQLDQEQINALENDGQLVLQLEDEPYTLLAEEAIIQSDDIPGWSIAKDKGLTVALDLNLSEELQQEGLARELVNRVQNMRKDQGLEVQDKIRIKFVAQEPLLAQALEQFGSYIKTETQAVELAATTEGAGNGSLQTIDLNEHELKLAVERV